MVGEVACVMGGVLGTPVDAGKVAVNALRCSKLKPAPPRACMNCMNWAPAASASGLSDMVWSKVCCGGCAGVVGTLKIFNVRGLYNY